MWALRHVSQAFVAARATPDEVVAHVVGREVGAVETCYPFAEFLKLKRKYDPAERFQSDWYRHYKAMFAP